jgi:chromosome segregation ATPase
VSSIAREEVERVLAALGLDPRNGVCNAAAAAIRALAKERDEAQARNAVVERITAEVVPDNERLRAQLAEAVMLLKANGRERDDARDEYAKLRADVRDLTSGMEALRAQLAEARETSLARAERATP